MDAAVRALVGGSGADVGLVTALLRCSLPPCVASDDVAGLVALVEGEGEEKREHKSRAVTAAAGRPGAWGAAYALVALGDLRSLPPVLSSSTVVSSSLPAAALAPVSPAPVAAVFEQAGEAGQLHLLLQGCLPLSPPLLYSPALSACLAAGRLAARAAACPGAAPLLAARLALLPAPHSSLAALALAHSARLHAAPLALLSPPSANNVSAALCSGPRRAAVASIASRRRTDWRLRLARSLPEAPEAPELLGEVPEVLPEAEWHEARAVALAIEFRRRSSGAGAPDLSDPFREGPSSGARIRLSPELALLHARLARLHDCAVFANGWRNVASRSAHVLAMARARAAAAVLRHLCAERDAAQFPKTVGGMSELDVFSAAVGAVGGAMTAACWAAVDELLLSANVWPNVLARLAAAEGAHHAATLRLAVALSLQ